jgi:hypothetical protein
VAGHSENDFELVLKAIILAKGRGHNLLAAEDELCIYGACISIIKTTKSLLLSYRYVPIWLFYL